MFNLHKNKTVLKTESSLVSQTDADPQISLSFHENISVTALLEKSLLVSRYLITIYTEKY